MAPSGQWVQRAWQTRGFVSALLLPVACVFAALAAFRRLLFRLKLLNATRLPVPVVVVGNITVGGTGKTPLVIALIRLLQAAGFHPGVVSRGYGGSYRRQHALAEVSGPDAAFYGDEIVLIQERCGGIPAAVGHKRAHAAQALLKAHTRIDVVVCDDGLQHYGLARDIELAVFDERLTGNGRRLPAGPLRESADRLSSVDAVVFNGAAGPAYQALCALARPTPCYRMVLGASFAYQLIDPSCREPLTHFVGRHLLAAAGIGVPERFFTMLESLGLAVERLPLPDHFDFRVDPFAARLEPWILITEKDAVKCKQFSDPRLWVVSVDAVIEDALVSLVLEKLRAWK